MDPGTPDPALAHIPTIEAFADTIIPGQKRFPEDRAVAGAALGGGAVAAGAVALLNEPGGGLAEVLGALSSGLDGYALGYAAAHDLVLAEDVPPFVALAFAHRTALVQELTSPEHPEKQMWVALALFCNMAFDSAAHLNTTEAFARQHPGLLTMGYLPPDADGSYRFADYSYGRQLAPIHPQTTVTGDPA